MATSATSAGLHEASSGTTVIGTSRATASRMASVERQHATAVALGAGDHGGVGVAETELAEPRHQLAHPRRVLVTTVEEERPIRGGRPAPNPWRRASGWSARGRPRPGSRPAGRMDRALVAGQQGQRRTFGHGQSWRATTAEVSNTSNGSLPPSPRVRSRLSLRAVAVETWTEASSPTAVVATNIRRDGRFCRSRKSTSASRSNSACGIPRRFATTRASPLERSSI